MKHDPKATVVAWLQGVLAATGWDAAELARRSGVSPSTLSRALRSADKHVLSFANVQKIAAAASVPAPGVATSPQAPPSTYSGLGEEQPEVLPIDCAPPVPAENAHLDHWTLRSAALEAVGYRPGDTVAVDRAVAPRVNDIVLAQIYAGASAETVFRFYDPPFLVTRPIEARAYRKPEIVDGARVLIVGVAVASWRGRHS